MCENDMNPIKQRRREEILLERGSWFDITLRGVA